MWHRKKTGIQQHDISDCAVACIASIARHYGQSIPLAVLREASGTSGGGTTVKGIIDACRIIGFEAYGYKSEEKEISQLQKIEEPVILHTVTRYGDLHFIVLYKAGKKKSLVMDPAYGTLKKLSNSQLINEWSGYLVTVKPDPSGISLAFSYSHTDYISFHNLATSLSLSELTQMILGSVVYIVAGICTALFLQHIIDNVIPSSNPEELLKNGAVMLSIMAGTLVVGYGRMINTLRISISLDGRMTLDYLKHLFSLPVGFFSRRGVGELHSRLNDVSKIRTLCTEGLSSLITSSMILLVSFILMFKFHWRLALLMLVFIPLYLIIYLIAGKINKRINREIVENSSVFEEKCIEGIGAARTLKYFGNEGRFFRQIEKQYINLSSRLYKGGKYISGFATWTDTLSKLLTLTLLTAGSLFIVSGTLTVGELVSFYALTSYFASPLAELVNMNDMISEASISKERLSEIFDIPSEKSAEECLPIEETGDILFNDVSFSYPGAPSLLEHLDITIQKGKITAIRGESGCGKSSLASLLMRDWQPDEGKIYMGETDISLFDLEQWRSIVSIVPQETELMNCTILQNITCLEANPDIKRVSVILNDLGLKDFINKLPMGILTRIGERGCKLSGGQKQRIALARALYKEPSILILDEATSSLDDSSQEFILNKIISLRNEGKTIIMISHKHDNIRIADNVIDLDMNRQSVIPS